MTPATRETADHAELVRLAEAATPGPWKSIIDDTGGERSGWPLCIVPENGDDRSVVRTGGMWPYEWDAKVSQHEAVSTAAFIADANPATVLALLSEIAALRVDRDEWRNWYRKASVEINEQTDRLTQAERQRDELRKALEFYADRDKWSDYWTDALAAAFDRNVGSELGSDEGETARQVLANQGAEQ